MAKAKFNENGVLVNAETGEPIGTKTGNSTIINSAGSEMRSLEDYGVLEPDFPEEEDAGQTDDDGDFVALNPRQSGGTPLQVTEQSVPTVNTVPGPSSRRRRTKYEISDESYFVVRFGLVPQEGGRFIPVKDEEVDGIPTAERHWVKFRMWNYGEELKWKSEFLEYSNTAKTQFLNIDRLNERKIKCLMLDWSFGEYDDSLKVLLCDGRLSDESYALFLGMYPSIANTIVDMMNLVLESNQ